VAVINGHTCDAQNTTGCATTPALIHVGSNPEFGALDPQTKTLYVANFGGTTVSVINLRKCNSTIVTGCASAVVSHVPSGANPFAVAVDIPTNTIYVTNDGSGTVTVINGRTCNGTVHTGCGAVHHEYVGISPGGIAVEQATNTVYVADETSSDVSMFRGATCDSLNTTQCGQLAFRWAVGNGDRGIAVNTTTNTVYVADTDNNTVLVFSGRACNGVTHTGCRAPHFAHVGSSPRRVVIDEATNTIYISNAQSDTVSMLNGRTCNGTVTGGC